MNNKKKLPWKYVWGETIVITILTVVLSIYCSSILQFFSLENYFQQTSTDNEFPASLFQYIYANRDENNIDSSAITIINTGYMTKRDDIAKLLDTLYSMKPEKIGVDILFKQYNQSSEDSILASVVNLIKDKATFVSAIDNGKVVHSYFCSPDKPEYCVAGISEGLSEILLDKDRKSICSFRFKDVIGGDTVNTLVTEMMSEYLNETTIDFDDYIIRYKKLHFSILPHDSLQEESIKNKLVIVGSMYDGQDQYLTPMGVLSGVLVHAQIANMIFDNCRIEKAGWFLELLFSLITLIIFVFFLVYFDYKGEGLQDNNKKSLLQELNPGTFILSLVFIILTGSISYWIYVTYGILISMSSALIGITLLVLFIQPIVHFISKNYIRQTE